MEVEVGMVELFEVELLVVVEFSEVVVLWLVLDVVDLAELELDVVALVTVALVVVEGVTEYVKLVVAEPDAEPKTYVALTSYVPDAQFGPPVTNRTEYDPSTVLTCPSLKSTSLPVGLVTLTTTSAVPDGGGETVPETIKDWAPE